jgi:hypothetical protein
MQTVTFNTSGTGYWSNTAKQVRIVDIRVNYVSEDRDFGELCVYFNTQDWDCNTLGLIYTDKQFVADLRTFLAQHNIVADVSYSEQGMQGSDYVSFDIESDFITAWERKFGQLETY